MSKEKIENFNIRRLLNSSGLAQIISSPLGIILTLIIIISSGNLLNLIAIWGLGEAIPIVIIYLLLFIRDLKDQIAEGNNNIEGDYSKIGVHYIILNDILIANILNISGDCEFRRELIVQRVGENEVSEIPMNFSSLSKESFKNMGVNGKIEKYNQKIINKDLHMKPVPEIINKLDEEMENVEWIIQFDPIENVGDIIEIYIEWKWRKAFNFKQLKEDWTYFNLIPHKSYNLIIVLPENIEDSDIINCGTECIEFGSNEKIIMPICNKIEKGKHKIYKKNLVYNWTLDNLILLHKYRIFWNFNNTLSKKF